MEKNVNYLHRRATVVDLVDAIAGRTAAQECVDNAQACTKESKLLIYLR